MLYKIIFGLFFVITYVKTSDFHGSINVPTYGPEILKVQKTDDFNITGDGSKANWTQTDWVILPQRKLGGKLLLTRIKMLYSETGLYFLFNCQDEKLTVTNRADFMDLWKEDVAEVFLWPDQDFPDYFEYEISPLNYELPILISNKDGNLVRWQPFHYDKDRKTTHASNIQGFNLENNTHVSGWITELFIPYNLLRPLKNISPKPGTEWRANFYRVDYDDEPTNWSWQKTEKTFHDYRKFGVLLFE